MGTHVVDVHRAPLALQLISLTSSNFKELSLFVKLVVGGSILTVMTDLGICAEQRAPAWFYLWFCCSDWFCTLMLMLTSAWCFRGKWKLSVERIALGWLHRAVNLGGGGPSTEHYLVEICILSQVKFSAHPALMFNSLTLCDHKIGYRWC